jgi:hypothetical protein
MTTALETLQLCIQTPELVQGSKLVQQTQALTTHFGKYKPLSKIEDGKKMNHPILKHL